MPVDPGNLLCLGWLRRRAVIGLPGCARSPLRNGVDLILERLFAGFGVDSDVIAGMGVGGLLGDGGGRLDARALRSEEHTSELQSLMRISYAVFCLKKKKQQHKTAPSQV